MLSAHLVFADINNHSALHPVERAEQLEMFRDICLRHQPESLTESYLSFYEVDNDSLMAGFCAVPGMTKGGDVVIWALNLRQRLLDAGIEASFAASLLTTGENIDWNVRAGWWNDAQALYTSQDIFGREGPIIRSRLSGDPLITVARMLMMAKKLRRPIIFSVHVKSETIFDPFSGTASSINYHNLFTARELPRPFRGLKTQQREWLQQREIDLYEVRRRFEIMDKSKAKRLP